MQRIDNYTKLKNLGKSKNAGKVNEIAVAFLTNNRKLFQTAENNIKALNNATVNNAKVNNTKVNNAKVNNAKVNNAKVNNAKVNTILKEKNERNRIVALYEELESKQETLEKEKKNLQEQIKSVEGSKSLSNAERIELEKSLKTTLNEKAKAIEAINAKFTEYKKTAQKQKSNANLEIGKLKNQLKQAGLSSNKKRELENKLANETSKRETLKPIY